MIKDREIERLNTNLNDLNKRIEKQGVSVNASFRETLSVYNDY